MKLATFSPFMICLAALVTNCQAQTLPIFDDFEDGNADDWIAPEYNLAGSREVVDGNFVLTGNQRFNSIDTEWGTEVYGDVSIHTLFKITAEDSAGVFARSTLAGPLASRRGYQPYGVLHGDGRLALGHAIGNAAGTRLKDVSVGFDPTGQDVHLQFDVAGIQASLTAWLDGTEQPPPQIKLNLPYASGYSDEGKIGIWTFQPGSGAGAIGPVEFQFVEAVDVAVADTRCDINSDGFCDANDLSRRTLFRVNLVEESTRASDIHSYDFNNDGSVNSGDLEYWLSDAATRNGFGSPYLPGDANLNGAVEFDDFLALSASFNGSGRDWALGNFDGDRDVDFADFLALSANYENSASQAAAVPEPTETHPMLLVLALLCFASRRSSAQCLESVG